MAPIISPDGRYVLFASLANNLVPLATTSPLPVLFPLKLNVFLRDRTNQTTTLVSGNLAGTGGGNGDSLPTGLSSNGQYVLFESSAGDLVAGDTNNAADVFLRDLNAGTNLLVSVNTNGRTGNGASRGSVMTPDGRYVAFVSEASDLVAGDTQRHRGRVCARYAGWHHHAGQRGRDKSAAAPPGAARNIPTSRRTAAMWPSTARPATWCLER